MALITNKKNFTLTFPQHFFLFPSNKYYVGKIITKKLFKHFFKNI